MHAPKDDHDMNQIETLGSPSGYEPKWDGALSLDHQDHYQDHQDHQDYDKDHQDQDPRNMNWIETGTLHGMLESLIRQRLPDVDGVFSDTSTRLQSEQMQSCNVIWCNIANIANIADQHKLHFISRLSYHVFGLLLLQHTFSNTTPKSTYSNTTPKSAGK